MALPLVAAFALVSGSFNVYSYFCAETAVEKPIAPQITEKSPVVPISTLRVASEVKGYAVAPVDNQDLYAQLKDAIAQRRRKIEPVESS